MIIMMLMIIMPLTTTTLIIILLPRPPPLAQEPSPGVPWIPSFLPGTLSRYSLDSAGRNPFQNIFFPHAPP